MCVSYTNVCILQTWKILHYQAPNDINLNFYQLSTLITTVYTHNRLGVKTNKAQASVRTDYDNSFKIKAARHFLVLHTFFGDKFSLSTQKVVTFH